MRPRVYIDTSVIGGCLDEEFLAWSNRLVREINRGLKVAIISDLTLRELEGAPEPVKRVYAGLSKEYVEIVQLTEESEGLANEYVHQKAVEPQHIVDAQHIAIATVERVDVVVSWNFKQIVNLDKIHLFNSVNIKLGYSPLEIRSPREVVYEKEI